MTGRSGAVVDDEEEYEEVEEYEEESDMRSADCSSGDWGERGDETTSNQFSNHRYHLPPYHYHQHQASHLNVFENGKKT